MTNKETVSISTYLDSGQVYTHGDVEIRMDENEARISLGDVVLTVEPEEAMEFSEELTDLIQKYQKYDC